MFTRRRIIILLLVGVVVGVAIGCFWPKRGSDADPQLLALVNDLNAKEDWYYVAIERWHIQAKMQATTTWVPQYLVKKAQQQGMKVLGQQFAAKNKLIKMGTNAWPVLPELVRSVASKSHSAGAYAAMVLAGIMADESPDYVNLMSDLRKKGQPVPLFVWLLDGKDQSNQEFDHRTKLFALRSLAMLGPDASPAIPQIRNRMQAIYDHELRCQAMVTLGAVATNNVMLITTLKQLFQDTNEWPDVRGTALEILARVDSNREEVLSLLHQSLNDERSLLRLKAAHTLWQIKPEPDVVLPVLTNCLIHKLASVRLETLQVLAGMKSAARPAIPLIISLLSDTNSSIRLEATNTLQKIALNLSK